ncbi:MAG: HEAT repeat domain-containing protein, partial [Verrucomicrobiota bacterium]
MLCSIKWIWRYLLIGLAGLQLTSAAPKLTSSGNISSVRPTSFDESLPWLDSLDNGLGIAQEQYRPVVLFFHSPDCGWCLRMKAQVFSDSAVNQQLEHFVRVRVLAEDEPKIAGRYLVNQLPAIRILSADGRIQARRDGFVSAPEMVRLLRGALNTEFLEKEDPEFRKLLEQLKGNKIDKTLWPEVMKSLGNAEKRDTLRTHILQLDPFPRKEFVSLLGDTQLSVRMGALEVLEELSGDTFGFDPWSPENAASIDKWNSWADTAGSGLAKIYSLLTDDQIAGYIRDMVGDNQKRASRAKLALRRGGDNAANSLQQFLKRNQNLPSSTRDEVRTLLYAMVMPSIGEHDSDTLARRLISGNLDAKLETITKLKEAGRSSMPVLADFLTNPDPLIRETAVDAILGAGRSHALPEIESRIKVETDPAVIIAILRAIGTNGVTSGQKLVEKHAQHDDEDIAIMALETLGTLRASSAADTIKTTLEDERWRVRVGSLEAIGKIKGRTFGKAVRPLLKDSDEFVRVAAVQTIATLNDKEATDDLLEVYKDHPTARGPVISA